MPKIGAITIGQSPRNDITPDLAPIFGNEIELLQAGALDGLSREEIHACSPTGGDQVLVTRLRDGSSVVLGESHILPRLQAKISLLEREGVAAILFLCTGEFPDTFQSTVPLIFPNNILIACVPALTSHSDIAVITPSPDQISQVRRKWDQVVRHVVVTAASPYASPACGDAASMQEASFPKDAAALARTSADLVVLDCIGYTCKMKQAISALTGKPVILPRTLMAHMIKEMF